MAGDIAAIDTLESEARPAVADGYERLASEEHQLVRAVMGHGDENTERSIVELVVVLRACAGLTSISRTSTFNDSVAFTLIASDNEKASTSTSILRVICKEKVKKESIRERTCTHWMHPRRA